MQTIAIVNEKGGIGKTTATVSLGGAMSKAGLRVCLIDLDPQASLTDSFVLPRLPAGGAAALFDPGQALSAHRLIIPTAFANLSVLPGSHLLNPINVPDPAQFGGRQFVIRDLVAELGGEFDRILIDCPPNLYLLSWAAMTGADFVVTPTRANRFGVQAIQAVSQAVAECQVTANPALSWLAILLAIHKPRSAIHSAYTAALRQRFPALLLDAAVPDAAVFEEASAAQKPIAWHKPRSAAARAVALVVDEIEARMLRGAVRGEAA